MGRALLRARLLEKSRLRSYQSLDADLAPRLWNAGIRNEMAVIDAASGEVRSGIDGLLLLIEQSRLAPLAGLLAAPPLRWLATLSYRLIAYNRRILAPPRPRSLPCACDPDPHAGYQGALIALLLVPAASIVALFAARLSPLVPEAPAWAAAVLPAAGATLGVLAAVVLARAAAQNRLTYLGHLAAATFLGSLPLLAPIVASSWFGGTSLLAIAVAGVALSAIWIWREQRRRHGAMGLGPARSWTWPVLVWGGTLAAVMLAQS